MRFAITVDTAIMRDVRTQLEKNGVTVTAVLPRLGIIVGEGEEVVVGAVKQIKGVHGIEPAQIVTVQKG